MRPRVLRSSSTIFVDHLIYLSDDLEATAAVIRERFGFGSVAGGVHPGGTCNVIVPLAPPQYFELLGVADPEGDNGRLLSAYVAAEGEHLSQWAVRVDDIDAVAQRLGLEPQPGSVANVDGSTASWRGVAHPDWERLLPFFIEYDDVTSRRRKREEQFTIAAHDVAPGAITWIEVGGDQHELTAWLGANDLPVMFTGGDPGIGAAGIATEAGEVTIPKRLR